MFLHKAKRPPRLMIIENVLGLLLKKKGQKKAPIDWILDGDGKGMLGLRSLTRYRCFPVQTAFASWWGLPMPRGRCFIILLRCDAYPESVDSIILNNMASLPDNKTPVVAVGVLLVHQR